MRFRPRSSALAIAACLMAAVLASAAPSSGASSSNTSVNVTVLSATQLDSTGCAPGTAGVTHFGSVLPGASLTTTADCVVTFGSSNDTAMLRMSQTDAGGAAMWAPPRGPLDTSFDSDGVLQQHSTATDEVGGIAVQPDGKILFTGRASSDTVIGRYNANGTVDTTFNGTGFLLHDYGSSDFGKVIGVLPDGRIWTIARSNGGPHTIGIGRFSAAGVPDTTCDTDGYNAFVRLGANTHPDDAVVLDDGSMLILGDWDNGSDADAFLMKLTPTCQLDTSYGTGGYAVMPLGSGFDSVYDMAVQSDGKVLWTESTQYPGSNRNFVVARATATGVLDTTFDGDGIAYLDGGANDYARDVAVQEDGRIVVVGQLGTTGLADSIVARFTATGAVDTTFNGTGRQTISFDAADDAFSEIDLLPDGRITTVGYGPGGAGAHLFTARLRTDGTLDTTLNGTGSRAWSIGTVLDQVGGMGVDGDGRLVVGATSCSVACGTNSDFGFTVLSSDPIPDYSGAPWGSGGSQFGACLRSVSGAGVTPTWTANATCPLTVASHWNAVPTLSTAPAAKVAASTTATTTGATANLRFGLRVGSTQAPGSYLAQVTFTVIAPNV